MSNPASVAPYYHQKSGDFKTIVALGNTNQGYSYQASAKVEKTFDWGLYVMGSYTYGHSFTANDGLSSQAHSNLTTNPSVDTNAPELSYSLFDIPHKVAAIVAYNSPRYAGGLLGTSVSLAYTGTSGQRYSALEGAEVIKSLIGVTGVEILAGAGVTPVNVRELVQKTGVREVHGSCKHTLDDGTIVTDAAAVRQMIDQTLTL